MVVDVSWDWWWAWPWLSATGSAARTRASVTATRLPGPRSLQNHIILLSHCHIVLKFFKDLQTIKTLIFIHIIHL